MIVWWWALTVSPTDVAVWLHGAPTTPPCECYAQRHWDCRMKRPRLLFGAGSTCWPQLGGASGMLHRTGVVMAPRGGISGDGSDAATRRGVEGTRRPQWTMSSTVEDVLQEGNTSSTDMRLSDFLWNYFGRLAAVDEDHNVTMQVFLQEPDAYVQDQRLLRIIFNLTEYREMKRELDEMKILLEDITKLHHENGVFSIEQWKDYEGKDTVTPIPKAKPNRVLIQILTEERQRRAQEMKLPFPVRSKMYCLKEESAVNEMRLNDFLTRELDGRGIVDTNRDVLLEEFFKDSTKYIRDKGALNEIQASGHYLSMKRAAKGEVTFDEDIRKLCDKGVNNPQGRSLAAAEVKATVHNSPNIYWMRLPRRRGTQRRRAHRRNWRDATSLCTMRGGAIRWNFRTAWSERKRGWEWGCMRGSQNSHGRTRKLTTLSKRMTLCSNLVQHLPC
ncbi:putative retrotransposon hot spot (RHS) protein [Trypanosoma cruzi]|uniref:Putative retrotransposon hot spot (RHS) protein n=1 Tax=Trypanosoma cruzi TaxID=5693 RepID=A0A2V2WGM2_TRYCR|nr:putative retrotransposon hot spot (RHS) protein [Trypanosoma cruzi]